MIFGYAISVVASIIAGGLVWVLSLFSAPLWAQIMIGGAVCPLFLASAFLWIGGMYCVWREFVKKESDDE